MPTRAASTASASAPLRLSGPGPASGSAPPPAFGGALRADYLARGLRADRFHQELPKIRCPIDGHPELAQRALALLGDAGWVPQRDLSWYG
jgi:hypothetical protein